MPRTYYWHIHHEVIGEPTDDIEERKEYVRLYKSLEQVEIRLRLMIPVKDQDSVDKAYEKCRAIRDKAREEYSAIRDKAYEECRAFRDKAYEKCRAIRDKAWEDYETIRDKAREEYEATESKAWEDYNAKLWDLHKKEHPDCPWDGKTIFPEED